MQVLVALARAAGRVVSRSDLEFSCWAGRVVGDDAINRVISALRQLSAKSGRDGFVLETLPKTGYRLIEQRHFGALANEPIVAILPFESLGDTANQWLSDALSQEILQTIARSTSIRVIGRASSFHFREASAPIRSLTEALSVTHILGGSVQSWGAVSRVSAYLVEATTETITWSGRFELTRSDPFTFQDEIAEKVAVALDRTFAAAKRPRNVAEDAYEAYLEGAELTRDISAASQCRAIALLERATIGMPDFADAWGNLALAEAQAAFFDEDNADLRKRAVEHSRRALKLDPECQTARLIPFVGGGLFDFQDLKSGPYRPAPSNFGRAASPDVSGGVKLLELGRVAEAVAFFERAQQFDPLFQIQAFYHGFALLAAGEVAAGLTKLDDAIENWPTIPFFTAARIRWAAAAGEWETVDALIAPERLARYPLLHRKVDVLGWVNFCRAPNWSADSFEMLRASESVVRRSGLEEVLLFSRAIGLAATFEIVREAGLNLFNREAPRRPDDLGAILLWLPLYRAVRDDAEFASLLRHLGVPAQDVSISDMRAAAV